MAGYSPLYIKGYQVGLVQEREEFLLPNDAYPVLENAFVWRERIKRKKGYQLLGRLRRVLTSQALGITQPSPWTFNIYSTITPPIVGQPNSEIEPGSVLILLTNGGSGIFFNDQGNGTLTSITPGNSGTINYTTGNVTLIHTAIADTALINFSYFPGIPVMGLRSRELNATNNEQLVAFDQIYAYIFINGWQEFIPGTTWKGNDSDFFWSTNYWVTPAPANAKLFWVTNDSGTSGDPIRYTDGTSWVDFAPQINSAGDRLNQCLAMLPFRGRLVVFNTLEGANLATSISFPNRIRWAAIGNPISDISALFPLPTNVNPKAWFDDIRGQGGFLDIPTSESIISVGFVRDNLVIYCERSTWQLRYTGRSISPFQIEKVNSELGAESTFSTVQFDTSLVGVGDKGIVECDSFKSDRIDIKIPDLVFQFSNDNNGTKRVHGIRDFFQRLAYWIYPFKPLDGTTGIFPDRRLVYNYENDSWAIFTDSLTTLGTYQDQTSKTWAGTPYPWASQNYPWINRPSLFPSIVGGNQQGFVEYLDQQVNNDISLTIQNITGNTPNPTSIKSVNHNMQTGQIIKITNIPAGTPFDNLNDGIFGISRVDADNFLLFLYDPATDSFNIIPQTDPPGVYVGGGKIAIRDNFSILSKKFNFLDDGQNIQLGFIDILFDNTDNGTIILTDDAAISLNVYLDYNNNSPINIYPQNSDRDTFFNSVVPTRTSNGLTGSKNWQRIFCPVRGAFITIEWTLSNAQMIGIEQESNVQIDAQILFMRSAGRQLPVGI